MALRNRRSGIIGHHQELATLQKEEGKITEMMLMNQKAYFIERKIDHAQFENIEKSCQIRMMEVREREGLLEKEKETLWSHLYELYIEHKGVIVAVLLLAVAIGALIYFGLFTIKFFLIAGLSLFVIGALLWWFNNRFGKLPFFSLFDIFDGIAGLFPKDDQEDKKKFNF